MWWVGVGGESGRDEEEGREELMWREGGKEGSLKKLERRGGRY